MANRKFLVPESGPDGSPGAPTYTFLNGATSGLYYPGTNGLGLSTNGGTRLTITSAGNVTIAAPTSGVGLTVSGGGASITGTTVSTLLQTSQAAGANAGAPDYSFSGDTNTGIYSSAADTLNLSVGGVSNLQLSSNTLTLGAASGNPVLTLDAGSGTQTATVQLTSRTTGTAQTATLQVSTAGDLNILGPSAGNGRIELWPAGSASKGLILTATTPPQILASATGSAAVPMYGFDVDHNSGMYYTLSSVAFAVASTLVLRVSGTEVITNGVPFTTVTQAGAPVSTPSDGALAVDTTNNRLYFRSGGVWRNSATVAGSAAYTLRTGSQLVFGAAGAGITFSASGGNVFGQDDGSVASSPLLRTLKVTDTNVALVAQVLYTLIDDLQNLGIVN